jgi:hypothetical protein
VKLYNLRDLHRKVFGYNKNYQRLYPIVTHLKYLSYDFLSESYQIRAKYNAKGLRDPGQKGYSKYQLLAILRMLADIAEDNSSEALAKLLTGQYARLRVSKKRIDQLTESNRYNASAISEWYLSQSGGENQLMIEEVKE